MKLNILASAMREKVEEQQYNFQIFENEIKSEHIGKLVLVSGRVVEANMPIPMMICAACMCDGCDHIQTIQQDAGEEKPDYIDFQKITIQSLKGDISTIVYLSAALCREPGKFVGKIMRIRGLVRNDLSVYAYSWSILKTDKSSPCAVDLRDVRL